MQSDQTSLRAVILSQDPIVIATETYAGNVFLGHAFEIGEILQRVPATLLIVPAGASISRPELNGGFKKEVARLREQHPNIRPILLANEESQVRNALAAGIEVELINQNAFLDERIYVPFDVEKRYDAVYNAQMLAFKRHYLATKIKSLALIYYGDDVGYYSSVRTLLPNAFFANGEPKKSGAGNIFRTLNAAEISRINSATNVGLCLSAAEGAMYACIEYLLCGIPVVTTESIGGRNELLNDADSVFCADDPDAVAQAVEELKSRNLSAADVRNRCLEKMTLHRDRFFRLMDGLRQPLSPSSRFQDEFYANFKINKIWKSRTPVSRFQSLVK